MYGSSSYDSSSYGSSREIDDRDILFSFEEADFPPPEFESTRREVLSSQVFGKEKDDFIHAVLSGHSF